jgi:hypothetical protein
MEDLKSSPLFCVILDGHSNRCEMRTVKTYVLSLSYKHVLFYYKQP